MKNTITATAIKDGFDMDDQMNGMDCIIDAFCRGFFRGRVTALDYDGNPFRHATRRVDAFVDHLRLNRYDLEFYIDGKKYYCLSDEVNDGKIKELPDGWTAERFLGHVKSLVRDSLMSFARVAETYDYDDVLAVYHSCGADEED